MCLIALAVGLRPELPLVIIANRDESFVRPTEPLHAWGDSGILAGRDRQAGGTWMGVAPARQRIAMVTNVRDPSDLRPKGDAEPSRGALVTDFLTGELDAERYASAPRDPRMRGFNLIAIDAGGVFWSSNRGGVPTRLTPGIHGVSNALLDTPWPKVVAIKERLEEHLAKGEPQLDVLFEMLGDERPASDASLPDTGVGLALERVLSPIRIVTPQYGTRCSTVIVVRHEPARPARVEIAERTLAPLRLGEVRLTAEYG